jgi:hypothetical protein
MKSLRALGSADAVCALAPAQGGQVKKFAIALTILLVASMLARATDIPKIGAQTSPRQSADSKKTTPALQEPGADSSEESIELLDAPIPKDLAHERGPCPAGDAQPCALQRGELHSNTRAARTDLIEAPKPKPQHATRNLILADALMFSSSLMEASAAGYGSHQCRVELADLHKSPKLFGHFGGGLYHPYQHDLYVALPFDAGVSLVSFWLHKKRHDTLAVLFPVSSASAQFSLAGIKYGAGCF